MLPVLSSHSILSFMAVVNPGDEVIIPTPYWVSYGDQVKMAEGCQSLFMLRKTIFKVTVEQLEAARTDKTRFGVEFTIQSDRNDLHP